MQVQVISLSQHVTLEVPALTVQTRRGQIQILDEHADMIVRLAPGPLLCPSAQPVAGAIRLGEEETVDLAGTTLFTGFGFLKVEAGKVEVLVDHLLPDLPAVRETAQARRSELAGKEQREEAEEKELAFLDVFLGDRS